MVSKETCFATEIDKAVGYGPIHSQKSQPYSEYIDLLQVNNKM